MKIYRFSGISTNSVPETLGITVASVSVGAKSEKLIKHNEWLKFYIYIWYSIWMAQALDILRNSLANHGGTSIHISIHSIYKYIYALISCKYAPITCKYYILYEKHWFPRHQAPVKASFQEPQINGFYKEYVLELRTNSMHDARIRHQERHRFWNPRSMDSW